MSNNQIHIVQLDVDRINNILNLIIEASSDEQENLPALCVIQSLLAEINHSLSTTEGI